MSRAGELLTWSACSRARAPRGAACLPTPSPPMPAGCVSRRRTTPPRACGRARERLRVRLHTRSATRPNAPAPPPRPPAPSANRWRCRRWRAESACSRPAARAACRPGGRARSSGRGHGTVGPLRRGPHGARDRRPRPWRPRSRCRRPRRVALGPRPAPSHARPLPRSGRPLRCSGPEPGARCPRSGDRLPRRILRRGPRESGVPDEARGRP
jgi:hypothetical protein